MYTVTPVMLCPVCIKSKHHFIHTHTHTYLFLGGSMVAQMVKNLPAMQEMHIQFLGQEEPLEKEMTAHSSILAWRILWTQEPDGLQLMGLQKRQTRLSNKAITKAYIS